MYAMTDPTGDLTNSSPPPHAGKSSWLDYKFAEPEIAMRFAAGPLVEGNGGAIESGTVAAAEVNGVLRTQA